MLVEGPNGGGGGGVFLGACDWRASQGFKLSGLCLDAMALAAMSLV